MVKMEHVLMLAIVLLILYHFMGRCGCGSNGFSVGGKIDNNGCPDISSWSIGDAYDQMKTCYEYDKRKCKFRVGSIYNSCVPESDEDVNCNAPSDESTWQPPDGWEGWRYLTRDQQKDICEQVYPKLSNRNLDCKLNVTTMHNTCIPK